MELEFSILNSGRFNFFVYEIVSTKAACVIMLFTVLSARCPA